MEKNKFVPNGAATWPVDFAGPPKEYVFVLLENLTMLALSSVLEPLRIANQVARKELYNWVTMTADGAAITCSSGQRLTPDKALEPISRSATAFVVSGTEPRSTLNPIVTQWVRRQKRLGSRIGGICTGAFTLAKAGLLDGKKFTLHWENQASFVEMFSDPRPTNNLYETDDDLLTAAGGAAGMDLILQIIEEDFGNKLALVVADMCLHGRSNAQQRPQRSSQSALLENRNKSFVDAVSLMEANLEEPLSLREIAQHVLTSRRQLERNFKIYLNVTPRQFYTDIRITRAYALLGETNMSVLEISTATGFNSLSNLSKHFKAKYGVTPSNFKKTWSGQAQSVVQQYTQEGAL